MSCEDSFVLCDLQYGRISYFYRTNPVMHISISEITFID
jgi:hypothetical protein